MDDGDYEPGDPGPARCGGRARHHNNQQHRTPDGYAWRQNEGYQQQNQGPPRGNHQRGQARHGQGIQQREGRPFGNQQRHNPDQRNQEGYNRRNDRRNNENDPLHRNNRQENRVRFLGFKALEEIAHGESEDIIEKINSRKEAFSNILETSFENDKLDMLVLIVKLISKMCQSSFEQLKLKFLLEICNSKFISSLRNYLLELPYAEQKARNRFYWNNPQEFWDNFASFCECIINISPATALHKCRSLIDSASKCCLELLKERHGFTLQETCNSKLVLLRERLTFCENEDKIQKQQDKKLSSTAYDVEPPDDFRQLSVIPNSDDMLDRRPFVRPNIVNGAYRDVDHYLDVQFRLLREDCFGPLREGIIQFKENPKGIKFDNIRVYHNVKFAGPYISKNKIGSIIQLDEKIMRKFKKINWANSKRFIFGSLLLFTKDNCQTFTTATILDRDPKMISEGKLAVSIVDTVKDNLYNDYSYVMIESDVYFEPYFHVLKALQDPLFPEHIAMNQYIVKVDPQPKPPAYLNPESVFAIQTQFHERTKFRVLQELTWPSSEDLGLNQSQYDAYKLALTHEFAVIQGPPGTGKTFLGVKVAKTILENLTPQDGACLMLVICYTNHALDQFLEAILPITESIVRIGGRSRNEAMENLNLNKLRTKQRVGHETNKLFYEQRDNLKSAIHELQNAQERLDSLDRGVISYDSIKDYVQESEILGQYYLNQRGHIQSDPLRHWLFENVNRVNFQDILIEEQEENIEVFEDEDEDIHERIGLILDDFDDDQDEDFNFIFEERIKTSFSLKNTTKKLKSLLLLYKKTELRRKQQELQQEIVDLHSFITLFNEMAANRNRECELEINNQTNLRRVPTRDRWLLYFKWAAVVMNDMKEHLKPLQDKYNAANIAYEESRMMVDLKLLKGIKVVGMTTSGAARMRKLLLALAPPIVIVEEAAEVLEQHIVTALTKHCEHLILIGDHQQLRPSAAHMKLARHYNMEISLFERMITNGIHSRRLAVQHRMRPTLAALISPHIYPDLQNHPSVERFPSVKGMTDNLFFLTHNFKEKEVDDSSSRSNHEEADIALRLANYLMQQGYKEEDVTILAGYSGQMFYMRKQREKYAHLAKIKITVVDNYQGEESKIIILSLVRNNSNNKIGFLGTENRVCVALSRAREGFYILGNIDILKRNSGLWTKIATTLQNNASLGTALMLKCENHPGQITTISSAKDFDKVPEGGCLLKCNYNLPCQHPCTLVCHGYDRGHVTRDTRCHKPCERILCDLNHVCPLVCSVKCGPCKRLVPKVLPCEHTMLVYCHLDANDPTIKCTTAVKVTLPNCGHEAKKSCYMKIESVKCVMRCVYRVDKCGHECLLRCHVNDDPDHEKYLCVKPCAKAKKGCSADLIGDRGDHQCLKRCHEDCDDCTVEVIKSRSTCKHKERVPCNKNVDETPCRKNCARILPDCKHFCKKKCFEKCGDCKQKVKKVIPDCNHEIEIICMKDATREHCTFNCERLLPCGHHCKEPCRAICDPSKCTELIPQELHSPCGHKVFLPCNVFNLKDAGGSFAPDLLLRHCTQPCNKELECGHACAGTCAKCHQGRIHAPCARKCDRPNICGHLCNEPCNQVCPPCNFKCEIKCVHTRCNKLCGEPCVPCQEKCVRRCIHGECSRRCGEPCSRPACDAACPARLRCGHRCRGLCGEPCPDICRICRPDNFPKDLLDDDYDDDVKLIWLEDCTHFLDVETMDSLMMGDKESIEIRSCPFCRKPIINTNRYKDVVNNMLKTEINPIKERVYGNETIIKNRKDELYVRVINFAGKHHNVLKENINLKLAIRCLDKVVMTQKKVSLLKLEMQWQYLDIMSMVVDCYQAYKEAKLTELKLEFFNVIEIICLALTNNVRKISQQMQMDIGNELKRLSSIVQLSKILSHTSYLSSKNVPNIVEAGEEAKKLVLTWGVYYDMEALKALNRLQDAVKVIISKQEIELVIKAIGSKAGSWYKCPNGHPYCISHCGGAMEISHCPDCGARVGGTNHTLLADNRHAGEIDGSRHAAWSNEYDNMANFNFN